LKELDKLGLPVYSSSFGDYRCHFRDVVKRLARNVLVKKNPEYNPKGIGIKHLKLLERMWNSKYPDLRIKRNSWNNQPLPKSLQPMENLNSGRLFSALFIVNNLEKAHCIKKYHRQEQSHQLDLNLGGGG